MRPWGFVLIAGCFVGLSRKLEAQAAPDAPQKPAAKLDTLVATGRTTDLVGIASSPNQGTVGAADLALRPLLRPGEVVENVPGVIVTQHSGSGKANQYFLRGFNLDHGTDLAVSIDGVPVNMPSHAHGQGYADLNFLIPELVQRVDFKKGPYYADVGDFGSAGAFGVRYFDRLPAGLLQVDGGQLGYGRLLVANNVGSGNLMYAGELEHNDGPWTQGDNERKFDGVLRYARGNERQGFSVTALGYHNDWRSTDQVPVRAIADGHLSPFSGIDPTDAGHGGRYSLSADWRTLGTSSTSHVTAYAMRYDLDLFSNFTYYLNDPVRGDQIEQQDHRYVFGATATHTLLGALFGAPTQTTLGLDVRNDQIDNGLYHSQAQVRLSTTTEDRIVETSAAPYAENRTYWNGWLRTIVGLRADAFWFDVTNRSSGISGSVQSTLLSPKFAVVVGPWAKTELYVNGGLGFHSNDARGVTAAVDPATALARSKGGELGVRTGWIRGLQSSVSFWLLDLNSELVWSGDDGTNAPSGPTRRYGVEFANFYTPNRWLTLDADYAWSHTRFTDPEPEGNYVPEALVSTFDGGAAVHDLTGPLHRMRGGIRFRYFGPRPLTQDGSVSSPATSLVYADAGYNLDDTWNIGLAVFNVFNTRASEIDYYYTSRLPGEALSGVSGVHTHAVDPRSVRLSISKRFGPTAPHR